MKRYLSAFFIFLAFFVLFSPDRSSGIATVESFAIDRTVLHTDDTEMQTATLVLHTTDPSTIDDVRIAVNRGTPNLRGMFRWTPAEGFRQAENPGNNTVRLRSTPERITDETNGTVTFRFRWSVSPTMALSPEYSLLFLKETPNASYPLADSR